MFGADLHSQKYFSAFKNKNTFFLKQLTNYSFLKKIKLKFFKFKKIIAKSTKIKKLK